MTYKMDDTDRRILNRIQSDFPVTSKPYAAIADELGIAEADVMNRLKKLKKNNIIRRIGGNFVPEKLGYVSTLCAAKVPEPKIKAFIAAVNQYPGVTHNYLRENDFNVWFTFIAQSMDEIQSYLDEISKKTGVTRILNLPAIQTFKIKAHFNL